MNGLERFLNVCVHTVVLIVETFVFRTTGAAAISLSTYFVAALVGYILSNCDELTCTSSPRPTLSEAASQFFSSFFKSALTQRALGDFWTARCPLESRPRRLGNQHRWRTNYQLDYFELAFSFRLIFGLCVRACVCVRHMHAPSHCLQENALAID